MTRRQQRMLIVFSIGASIIIMSIGLLMLIDVVKYQVNSWAVSQFSTGCNWSSEATQQAYQKALDEFWLTEGGIYQVLLKVGTLGRVIIGTMSLVLTFGPVFFWRAFFRKPEKTKTNR